MDDNENQLAQLRERIAKLHWKGGHQSWCSLFGDTIGWNDELIHKIEPFIIKLLAQIQKELLLPFSDRERKIYKSKTQMVLDVEDQLATAEKKFLDEVNRLTNISNSWAEKAQAAEAKIAEIFAPERVKALSKAACAVIDERDRQQEVEGWTPRHDDEHCSGDLAAAAGCYAFVAADQANYPQRSFSKRPEHWPFATSWWKPKGARENLVRAGALIIAEIERIDRASEQTEAAANG